MPRGEISTNAIVHDAFKQGKRVFVPYIYKSHTQDMCGEPHTTSLMDMVALYSINDYVNLKPDSWGIPSVARMSVEQRDSALARRMETIASKVKVNGESSNETHIQGSGNLDMIIMPGLGFDRELRRLGHGKGFYDHFLERYEASRTVPMPFLGA